MKRQFGKSRIFRYWIGCYFIVLLIPLAFSAMLYRHSAEKLTQKAYENTNMYIQQAGGIIDEQLKTIYSVSDTICVSTDIPRLKYIELPFNAEKYHKVHQYAKYLNTFVAYQNLLDAIYIYCPQLDCIIDAGHIYTRINQYTQVINQRLGMEEAVFETIMSQQNTKRFLLTRNHLLLVQTISNNSYTGKPDLVLIMALNTQPFLSLMQNLEQTQMGSAHIILPDEDVLSAVSYNSMFCSASQYPTPVEKESIIASYQSQESPVSYTLSVPAEIVLQDVASTTTVFIYFVICTLIFGGILAYLLTRRNYEPVQRLKQTFNMEAQNTDEFNMIIRQSEDLKNSSKQAAEAVLKLSRKENTWMLTSVLSGNLATLDDSQIRYLRESLDGHYFVVAYFLPEATPDDSVWCEHLFHRIDESFCTQESDVLRCMIEHYHGGLAVILCHAGTTVPF